MVELGDTLYAALRSRVPIPPPTDAAPTMTIDDAYRASRRLLELRMRDGERVIGKKIGVTSRAVQDMLGVHQPDFGWLTDAMQTGVDMPISRQLIQPRAEGEIALTLGRDLVGPGITPADVRAAIALVHPCFEVVDSRIERWKIRIQDTVADNASSGLFTLGPGVPPDGVDFVGCRMVVHKNGRELSRGEGRAALGSPLLSVAWLANTLGGFGVALLAGEIVLSGSLVPLEPVVPGDHLSLVIDGIGSAEVRFS